MAIINLLKVITGICIFSFLNCWEPKAVNGSKPKYSVSLIIPKSDTKTVKKINDAIQAAYEEGQAKLRGNGKSVPPLSAIKTPLRDGDVERPDDAATRDAGSSTPVHPTHPASWMPIASPFWITPRCTAA